jgi:hypothetical protein
MFTDLPLTCDDPAANPSDCVTVQLPGETVWEGATIPLPTLPAATGTHTATVHATPATLAQTGTGDVIGLMVALVLIVVGLVFMRTAFKGRWKEEDLSEALTSWPFRNAPISCGNEGGIVWATSRGGMAPSINGYVHLPKGHPWRGSRYGEIDVTIHGALTYDNEDGWIGFDTMHEGDYWPNQPWNKQLPGKRLSYWTAEKVALEARNLARQAAIAKGK